MRICRVLRVSGSAYYGYLGRGKKHQRAEEAIIRERVREIFYEHSRRYGSRRIVAEMKAEGISVGRLRIRRLMRQEQLLAIRPRRFVPRTTETDKQAKASENLLAQRASPQNPSEVIVGDITYLPLVNGRWVYLASFQDAYTKRIVGWKVANSLSKELVIGALLRGLASGLIKPGAIMHSDRGSQYSSAKYRQLLKMHKLEQSMSGKGNCYDNAMAESFFSRFKAELLEDGQFRNLAEAISETFSYIEGYYNRVRRHSAIGYKTPIKYEAEFYEKEKREIENKNEKEVKLRHSTVLQS